MLEYGAAELQCQGVEPDDLAPAPSVSANCTAFAGLRLEYDFSERAWDGTFVEGPFKGTTKRMSVNDLDKGVWEN